LRAVPLSGQAFSSFESVSPVRRDAFMSGIAILLAGKNCPCQDVPFHVREMLFMSGKCFSKKRKALP
jgi:hypothetical protein